MMVVDTNVVAYLLIPGRHTAAAERARKLDRDWRVPALFRHEWLNVVTRHVRQQMFDRDEALKTYRRGLAVVRVTDSAPDPLRIINLHLVSGCSSYDCQFVDLAQTSGAQLLTLDDEILKAFPSVAVGLGEVQA